VRPKITETTALGAAYLAGLAVNFWGGTSELKKQWQMDRTFSPQIKPSVIEPFIRGWHRAVNAAKVFADDHEVNNSHAQP
jgi:glycerol kinase